MTGYFLTDPCSYRLTRQSNTYIEGMDSGTLRYMAPERMSGRIAVSSASDVYSFALTMWQMFSRKVPYATLSDGVIAMYSGNAHAIPPQGLRPVMSGDFPSYWRDVIESAWLLSPAERTPFTAIEAKLLALNGAPGFDDMWLEARRQAPDVSRVCLLVIYSHVHAGVWRLRCGLWGRK